MAGMNEGQASTTNSYKTSWSMMSYLARLNYNYKSKYYATASFRADGSSKFSKRTVTVISLLVLWPGILWKKSL